MLSSPGGEEIVFFVELLFQEEIIKPRCLKLLLGSKQ
jgi:hypothetical protein